MNCDWATALTRFDCRQVPTVNGATCLEIGTPFTLPDGSAINVYLVPDGTHLRISDNGDTLFQLPSMGLDIWQPARFSSLREFARSRKLHLTERGELFALAREEQAATGFAETLTGLIAVSLWVADKMGEREPETDLVAELEPYIIARNPAAPIKPHPKVRGASRTMHTFDLQHGNDLIDVLPANATATGGAMRKAGDVQNGPFAGPASPLFIVDDRRDPARAESEIAILGSMTRAMAATALMAPRH